MEENSSLAIDLALILISAGITTLIFKALKQPLILGYIVAGFLVGPHLGFFPTVGSSETIEQWSEIGIIFLLFGLGLEFSFKKLIKVGSTALIIVSTILIAMSVVGMWIGKSMGWNNIECMFLGSMLSMSSTTIIIKAFTDLGVKNQPFTQPVYGALIVEDLIAVVIMVLLSTMAASQNFEGGEMMMAILKLVFCLILWFLVGMYIVPTLLKKGRKFMNDEVLTVLSIGLCFAMVAIAVAMGFSAALGAFVMGSILAETLESEKIIHLIKGVKDIFGAVFFVSVGMLIDPNVIVEYWKPILILTLVVMTLLPLFVTMGVLFAGKGLDTAVRAGMTMAQIGEFAFIVASVGSSLHVMSPFLYPVIVTVSVITTFTTPYYIKFSGKVVSWLSAKLPEKVLSHLKPVDESSKNEKNVSLFNQLIKASAIRIVTYLVLLVATFIASNIWLEDAVRNLLPDMPNMAIKVICVSLVFVVMAPMLVGLLASSANQRKLQQDLWNGSRVNKIQLVAINIIKLFIAFSVMLTVLFHYFHLSWWAVLLISMFVGLTIWFVNKNIKQMNFLEERFLNNLNQKEMAAREQSPMSTAIKDSLLGQDISVETFAIGQESIFAGSSLGSMGLRSAYGVTIIKIVRGKKIINLPTQNDFLFPGDRILVFGTRQQLKRFMQDIETEVVVKNSDNKEVSIEKSILSPISVLAGKKLRDTNLRQEGCMLLGVRRFDESYMNPGADFVLEIGDEVWLVGEKEVCERFF